MQTVFTTGKVLAVLLIVVVGFSVGSHLPAHFQGGTMTADANIGPQGFLLALIAGLFAFGGWHVVTYTAEETIDPERTIPRALAFGILIVTACYVALNAVYFYVLPLDRVEKSTRVAADVATTLLGAPGGAAVSGLVMFSVFGAMTGSTLAAPRVYFAMARDGLIFWPTCTRDTGPRIERLAFRRSGLRRWSGRAPTGSSSRAWFSPNGSSSR